MISYFHLETVQHFDPLSEVDAFLLPSPFLFFFFDCYEFSPAEIFIASSLD